MPGKVRFTGVNGRPMVVDMGRAEMVEDAGDGEVWIHTSSDWYKVRGDYEAIVSQWMET